MQKKPTLIVVAAAVVDGSDLEARSRLLMGSHLAGLALSLSGLGLVHGIAHAITSSSGAAHGLALSAVLDPVMTRSLEAAAAPYAAVATAMGVGTAGASQLEDARAAVRAVTDLAGQVGARLRLTDLGVDGSAVPGIAANALADVVSSNHPRPFSQAEVEEILTARL